MRAARLSLVGLDIGGEWNVPLLANAAALAEADFVSARTESAVSSPAGATESVPLEAVLEGFRHVIACETGRDSVSLYDFPAPREPTAVIVGNEEAGIPRRVLKKAHAVASIPMAQSRLSSVNVAVAAAITLYALSRDLGRRHWVRSTLKQQDVDILIEAPADPHELGSLLRSAYAFGWRRVYLTDPHQVWFTGDPRVILESRAAARRANNLLAVLPSDQLDPSRYDAAWVCDGSTEGSPLSKARFPECRRLLIVYAATPGVDTWDVAPVPVRVDFPVRSVPARYRHSGSVLLSVVSQLLTC